MLWTEADIPVLLATLVVMTECVAPRFRSLNHQCGKTRRAASIRIIAPAPHRRAGDGQMTGSRNAARRRAHGGGNPADRNEPPSNARQRCRRYTSFPPTISGTYQRPEISFRHGAQLSFRQKGCFCSAWPLSSKIAKTANLRHPRTVSENGSKTPQVAPPAATGNAGPQFESKVGAFYLLSLLIGGEPRGLPGAVTRTVAFQQRGSGRPLDDVVIQATNADGSPATLEIQAKRTLTFTATDTEFKEVVAQMWAAAQKSEFGSSRYELAVAIARTTTQVEASCQEVLHWARQLPDGATFAAHINLEGFSSKGMRDFVEVFRANLSAAGALADDDTVWRLLRRFQILVFDFESYGSDYEHRARERARLTLIPEQASRASELWPILIEQAGASARAGGAQDRNAVLTPLREQHNFQFDQRADLRSADARLSEAASRTLDDIKDQVGGVRLARTELVDQAYVELEQRRILNIVGGPGVGKSAVMKHLAERLQPEGRIVVLGNGRIIPGGWLRMSHVIDCPVSQDELFNELGCGGGATLFIDNIDQIDDAGEWATVCDLLAGVAKCPGWRAVVTGGVGNDEWKTKLPQGIRSTDIGTLEVAELSDDETATLSNQNHALAIILGAGHPARGIARNLFYLSRMVELGASHAGPASAIATEIDLARLWWRYGGGRSEDAGRLARLKVLRAMGVQFVANPLRVAFRTDDFDSATMAELLRFDSLREDIKGATIAFRHDVLRDWTVGFLLHEDREGEVLKTLPFDKPLPTGLARGIEIAARLAIESDATGARWVALLDAVQGDGRHGSWQTSDIARIAARGTSPCSIREPEVGFARQWRAFIVRNPPANDCRRVRSFREAYRARAAVCQSAAWRRGHGRAQGHRLDLAGGMAGVSGSVLTHGAYPGRGESLSGLADIDPKPVVADQSNGRANSLRLAGAYRKQNVASVSSAIQGMLHLASIFPI